MNERYKVISELMLKHIGGILNEPERKSLDAWMAGSDQNKALFEKLTSEQVYTEALVHFDDAHMEAGRAKLGKLVGFEIKADKSAPVYHIGRWKYIAAASIIFIAVGVYIFRPGSSTAKKEITVAQTVLNRPVANRATLTLSDKSAIMLEDVKNERLPSQGKVDIFQRDSLLVYQAGAGLKQASALYNTIATPRGGRFQVELSDGTKAWLNAASSIQFPVAFIGQERRVTTTGEVYFEVAKNKALPFIVVSGGFQIKALGTHFNVKAYEGEKARASLLEGAIEVSKDGMLDTLRPGEEATVSDKGKIEITLAESSQGSIAWKEGNFCFDNANIQTFMNAIARRYDLDVKIDGSFPKFKYKGTFSQNLPIDTILKILDASNLRAKLVGKEITISHR